MLSNNRKMKLVKLFAAVFILGGSLGAVHTAAQHNHASGHSGGSSSGTNGGHNSAHQSRPRVDAGSCPLRAKIFEPVLNNLENGVEITLTAKDPRNIARLREIGSLHFTSAEGLDKNCPSGVQGAKTSLEETSNGVKITITAQDAAAVKTIQVTALYACKRDEPGTMRVYKTYVCPMGEYQSSRSGKCPQCGMDLVEKI